MTRPFVKTGGAETFKTPKGIKHETFSTFIEDGTATTVLVNVTVYPHGDPWIQISRNGEDWREILKGSKKGAVKS